MYRDFCPLCGFRFKGKAPEEVVEKMKHHAESGVCQKNFRALDEALADVGQGKGRGYYELKRSRAMKKNPHGTPKRKIVIRTIKKIPRRQEKRVARHFRMAEVEQFVNPKHTCTIEKNCTNKVKFLIYTKHGDFYSCMSHKKQIENDKAVRYIESL